MSLCVRLLLAVGYVPDWTRTRFRPVSRIKESIGFSPGSDCRDSSVYDPSFDSVGGSKLTVVGHYAPGLDRQPGGRIAAALRYCSRRRFLSLYDMSSTVALFVTR